MEKSPDSSTQDIYQIWFPGDHGCVGGGIEANRGLSDAALGWMISEAKLLGLDFDERRIQGGGLYPNHRTQFEPDRSPIYVITGQINREITGSFERNIHESAKKRWRDLPSYRPPELVDRYAQELNAWALQNPTQILIA